MVYVAIGGVIGSLFRYLLNELFDSDKTGILIANQIGVAIASYAAIYFLKSEQQNIRNFVLPGFCGGLTTFSSVMLLSNEFGYAYLLENLFISFLVISFIYPIARSHA
jgi:CrcB protein